MTVINTKLTTSGNSVAVRLPKELLKMSGLGDQVTLEAKKGKIIISKASNPKASWDEQIEKIIKKYGDPTDEFKDFRSSTGDEWDNLPWDGPSYEEWQKNGRKFS